MRAAGAICPSCSTPTFGGVCPHCAFGNALQGLTGGLTSGMASNGVAIDVPEGYELLHELGTGATAVVWLAREAKLDRLVALKLIATPADRGPVLRLIREGQAAAQLHHMNIVAVHALGLTATGAYLAMEFVAGGDLRQRLSRGLPSPRASADLVRKLAGALAHAHANGVLHRDVKPSNVLLDGRGEPHVADFGLAAPMEGAGDLTLPGQVAGTAAYLAPELLQGADKATAASDIYGLGAILYECITGRAPFVGRSAAEIFVQLARLDPAAPRLLHPEIPRDLETICLKCLDKSPALRYASAEALQEDLAHFLAGRPIAARPLGAAGRTIRWCRRNPVSATLAGAAALFLLFLAVGGPILALRLARANAQAALDTATATAVSNFLRNDVLAQASPEQQPERELKLRTTLDRAALKIEGRFAGEPLVEAEIRETLAKTYFALGEYESSLRQWKRVRHLREERLPATAPKRLEAEAGVFNALRALGRFAEAAALGATVVKAEREILGRDNPETLTSAINLANIYRLQGRLKAAEALYFDLLGRARRRLGPDAETTLWIINNLALVYAEEGHYAAAESLHRERLAATLRLFGPDHLFTITSMYNLALLCSNTGKEAEARRLVTEVIERRSRILGPDHPDTLHAKRILAAIEADTGQGAAAELLDREVLEAQMRKLGPHHPDTLVTKYNLGRLYRDEGRLTEAEPLLRETFEDREKELGLQNHFTLQAKAALAGIWAESGRLAEAERLGRQAQEDADRLLDSSSPMRVMASAEVGNILLAEAKFAEAEPLLRYAVDHWRGMGGSAWRIAVLESRLGAVLLELKRYPEAEAALQAGGDTLRENKSLIPAAYQSELVATEQRTARLKREQAGGSAPDAPRRSVADAKR